MKELSRITEIFSESVIREMTRINDEVGGVNLSQGFPDFDSPQAIKDAAVRAIIANLNQYPVTFGEPELRHAIAVKARQYNGMDCHPDTDITVTCGATEAMIATMKALINPGDEFIVFEPFYENYRPDGILSGATPRTVTLSGPTWEYAHGDLCAAFNSRTKAIIINTPNNPTGKVFTRRELTEIAELCLRHDVYAVTDEIYEHILYDDAPHVSMASLPGMADRTVTINSLSKTYSVTGWRVGWAIASGTITSRIRKVHDFVDPHEQPAGRALQHAGVAALGFDEGYYRHLADSYAEARRILCDTLAECGFRFTRPSGAYYVLADIAGLMPRLQAKDDTDFAIRLLSATGVACVPGSSFYANPAHGATQVRFAFCKRHTTLKEVSRRFTRFFTAL